LPLVGEVLDSVKEMGWVIGDALTTRSPDKSGRAWADKMSTLPLQDLRSWPAFKGTRKNRDLADQVVYGADRYLREAKVAGERLAHAERNRLSAATDKEFAHRGFDNMVGEFAQAGAAGWRLDGHSFRDDFTGLVLAFAIKNALDATATKEPRERQRPGPFDEAANQMGSDPVQRMEATKDMIGLFEGRVAGHVERLLNLRDGELPEALGKRFSFDAKDPDLASGMKSMEADGIGSL